MNQCYLSSLSSSIPSLQPRSSSFSSSHSRRRITTVPPFGPHTNVRSRFSRLAAIKPFPNPHHNDNDKSNENLSQNHRTQAQLANRNHSPPSLSSAAMAEMDQLTSGASNRIIPIVKAVRAAVVFLHALAVSLFVALLPRRRRHHAPAGSAAREGSPPVRMRKTLRRMEEEDTARRRALAEGVNMSFGPATGDLDSPSRWATSLFYGVRCNALFCRSWVPVSGQLKGILIIIHGLNEHSGRYLQFARQLNSCNFGVYAMDWIGHGGSDGLHGYVPSLEHVVADTGSFLEKIKSENPGVPCFLFGHSTGGAVVLKAASYQHIQEMLEGIVLTSPALRVRPAHPIVGAIAPIFSLLAPKFQFKGANKRGIPVTRDPVALSAKYSDPLVYTGPIRVRTGHEILRISSYLMRNFKSVTVPFFVLHGTADTVTDPLASQDLYNEATSVFKDIKLYDGFLHDLLFEPEREQIGQDIINWMENRLSVGVEDENSLW